MTEAISPKPRTLKGVVVSDKMQKTVVVRVDRLKKHPKYLKYMKISSRFKAHDEKGEAKTGDTVLICETKPISKEKRWMVTRIISRGQEKAAGEAEE